MLDWSNKELIEIYYYSNINQNRECTKSEIINGRLYDKHGVDCATTVVALLYKVYDPSNKQYRNAILVGIARQNPGDLYLTYDEGIEIATENAMINPIMTIEYPYYRIEPGTIYSLIKSYLIGIPIQFIKTRDELLAENKDLNKFNRVKGKDYYNTYYNDFKKLFLN